MNFKKLKINFIVNIKFKNKVN